MQVEYCRSKIGFLKFPCDGYSAHLYSLRGILRVDGKADVPSPLPTGEWRLLKYKYSDERTRSYMAAWGRDLCPSINIEGGQTATWKFGPPLNPFTTTDHVNCDEEKEMEQVIVRLVLEGRAAERVTALVGNGENLFPKCLLILTTGALGKGEIIMKTGFKNKYGNYCSPELWLNPYENHTARIQIEDCPFPVNQGTATVFAKKIIK